MEVSQEKFSFQNSKTNNTLKLLITIFLLFRLQVVGAKTIDLSVVFGKAENLVLENKRIEALNYLIEQEKNAPQKLKKKIHEKVNQISEVFLTENGLKAYESSKSYLESKPDQAVAIAEQALVLEKGNIKIMSHLAYVFMFLDQCEKSEGISKRALKLNPYKESLLVLNLMALDCQNKLKSIPLELSKKWSEISLLKIKKVFSDQGRKPALSQLLESKVQNQDYPTFYYWAWKLERGENDRLLAAEKYIDLCREKSFKKIYLDAKLCAHEQEIKSFVELMERKQKEL